jgi:hypothetical protein
LAGRADQDLIDGSGGIEGHDELDRGRDVIGRDRLDVAVRPREHAVPHGRVDVREQFGGDGAGLDAAHPDAVRGKFLAEGLGEGGDAELGRVVYRAAAARDPARHRPDVDQVGDAARTAGGRRPQVRDRLLSHVHQPGQVQLQHAAPVIVPAGVERAEQHDAGVVNQDVEPAELVGHPADGGPGLLGVGDVGRQGQHRPVLGRELGGEVREPVLAARYRGHQGTPAGQPAHRRPADAAARAGDQGDERVGARHVCSTDVVIAPRT